MLKHSDIWRGIDRLAAGSGYSPSGLAKQAGLDPTSFNKSKRVSPDGKPRWPSTESIAKILAVTGSTMTDFISIIDPDAGQPTPARKTIPLLGFAQAGKSGFFDEDGYPAGGSWKEIDFPPARTRADKNIYALEVSDDSMEPLLRKGDLLVISPEAKIRKGDRVVLKTRKGEVMAKELVRQSSKNVELKSLNASYENRILAAEDISWMARISWISQ
jgi:phage repressor protein C with HTH and peptisase S24 domain